MGATERSRQTAAQMGRFPHVRILLADMTTMLASIIGAALGGAPDLVVAGQAGDADDLAAEIRHANADVMVMSSTDPGNAAGLLPLLHDFPALRVLAISADCSIGFVHALRPHSTQLEGLSAEGLVAAVRGQVDRS